MCTTSIHKHRQDQLTPTELFKMLCEVHIIQMFAESLLVTLYLRASIMSFSLFMVCIWSVPEKHNVLWNETGSLLTGKSMLTELNRFTGTSTSVIIPNCRNSEMCIFGPLVNHQDKKFQTTNTTQFPPIKWVHIGLCIQYNTIQYSSIHINQPTRCNNFTSLLFDVYLQLNMFRASSHPSSGTQQLQ